MPVGQIFIQLLHKPRFPLATLFALICQQLIVASSNLWIVLLIKALSKNEPFEKSALYLGFYLASLLLPYFPGGLALAFLARAKLSLLESYQLRFTHNHYSKPYLWANAEEKQEKLTFLTTQSAETLDRALQKLYQLCAAGLNIILNIGVLTVTVDSRFFIAYLVSFLFSIFVLKTIRPIQQLRSLKSQTSKTALLRHLNRIWDNVTLGNAVFRNRWSSSHFIYFNKFKADTISLSNHQIGTSILICLLTFVPTLSVVISAFSQSLESQNVIAFAPMVVTLPRLFATLNLTYDFLFTWIEWADDRTKLSKVFSSLEVIDSVDSVAKRICWADLSFTQVSLDHSTTRLCINSLDDLLKKITVETDHGRLLIQGRNGSGKSSLLLLLKNRLADLGVLIPAKFDFETETPTTNKSSGQASSLLLKELLADGRQFVFLLDEWDANLDSENRAFFSEALKKISETRWVIEVRHRVT